MQLYKTYYSTVLLWMAALIVVGNPLLHSIYDVQNKHNSHLENTDQVSLKEAFICPFCNAVWQVDQLPDVAFSEEQPAFLSLIYLHHVAPGIQPAYSPSIPRAPPLRA